MCGIAGYVGSLRPGLGAEMARLLAHRGPDEAGERVLPRGDGRSVVLAHQRLAIIDIPGGHQPQTNEDGTVDVVFNGEIYNYRELRRDLERAGHRFATQSDTEVLVHLYEDHELGMLDRLRGMFAFALWDAPRQRLVLARDRLGVKPLYYSEPGGEIELAFASELKSLLLLPGRRPELDPEALDAYLAYLYVPHPKTAVRGIRKLPPAHVLVYEEGRASIRRYWALDPEPVPADEARVWELLREAVGLRLVADVPVGAFLSGGLDSTAIVAAAHANGARPDTFTVVFPDERLYDERDDAQIAAAAFETPHHELEARPAFGELLPTIVRHFDEPFGNPTALLTFELSRLTRSHVKVALSGDGADELFAGYPRFRGLAAAALYRRIPRPVRALAAAGARALPESTRGRHGLRRAREFALAPLESLDAAYLSWITYFDAEARRGLYTTDLRARLRESPPAEQFLVELFERAPRHDLVNRLSFVELQSFLPCNVLEYGDKMSMAHGLEVRMPFTDHRLVEYVSGVPGSSKLRRGTSKAILRRALSDRVPARTLAKRKLGFNPPLASWLRGDLASLVESHLAQDVVASRGLFEPKRVRGLVQQLRSGRRDVSLHVWALIVLEQWQREYAT